MLVSAGALSTIRTGLRMVEEASEKTETPRNAATTRAAIIAARRRNAMRAAPPPPAPVDEAEQNKVVQIVRWMEQEATRARTKKVKPWLLVSVLACIALPTLIAALYYFVIAADQYVSEARFAVRSNDAQSADVLGMITGMPRATVVSDAYIVTDYVRSAEMVEELERRIPFRAVYATSKADFLTRLNPTISREDLLRYWDRRVDIGYDSTKNTIAVSVRAFTPEDAQRIVGEIVDVTRRLVNDLSAQSRRDAVQFAAAEVARAELRVRGARQDILKFRTEHNDFDPSQTAAASQGLVAQMQGELSQLNSQLASVSGYLGDNAPSVQLLKAKIRAMREEIDNKQKELSSTDPKRTAGEGSAPQGALASVVSQYQELLVSQEFAESAYTAALASMERARVEADRTQSYLAIYMRPSAAESSTYPRRYLNTFMVFVFASVLWAIGSLGWFSVKDHMA
jgi:capsular polysaccharide transport system permease protein